MSVLIKDMEMPKNCSDCDFESYPRGAHYCQFKMRVIDSLERPDWCPLEEAEPKHGQKSKTISNADNLRSISNMQLAIFMDSVNACPYDRDDALFECEKWNGACDRCWLCWLKQKVEDEVEE